MQKKCIVIPCYNESKRFETSVFERFVQQHNNIDFLLVDDGSTDTTASLIQELSNKYPERVFACIAEKNLGKANAVRLGFLTAVQKPYTYIGYFDADFATPLEEVLNMVRVIESEQNYILLMGSRFQRLGSKINRDIKRHYLGRIFSSLASIILNLPVYDTQCGAKMIRSDYIQFLFHEPFRFGWLFDVELIARLVLKIGRNAALENIYEHPLRSWEEKGGSKLKWNSYATVPFQLLQLFKMYGFKIRKLKK